MYFKKIKPNSEPALKIEQDKFTFNHITVQVMAFSHLRFLEFSVPEIKRTFHIVFQIWRRRRRSFILIKC